MKIKKKKDLESNYGKTEQNLLDISRIIKHLGMEDLVILKEMNIQVN